MSAVSPSKKSCNAIAFGSPKFGLARALSKLGYCSRSQAQILINQGRVEVNGVVRRDPEFRVHHQRDRIEVDHESVPTSKKYYVLLNKPRGLVTSTSDEQGRETVYQCLAGSGLPWVAPVGRLDKASEGLLLLTNDTQWAAQIANPESHLDKTYHVQVNCLADKLLIERMVQGVREAEGEFLAAKRVRILRHGQKNSWLEIILDEGKNRQIRRLLTALGLEVLRLVRVAIGPLELGAIPKGKFRALTSEEVRQLAKNF